LDITALILDDHREQRKRFAMLEQIPSSDTSVLANLWTRLAVFLEVHAAAEEEIFYPELLRQAIGSAPVASAEPETLDAIGDHNEIRDAIAAVAGHPAGSQGWRDAVAAVNVANGDHMAEEEREGLTDVRSRVSLQRRHELAVAFADFEARNFAGVRPVDRDPQVYVRETEAAERAVHAPGSLSIGGLKRQ
jgi:Hemerythrin HHE cation binding domain